ncbi:tyrosine-type recombinase/integrase [Halosquirtibacter xylanolyticus]|uniref:tyrosine-type recombinase/integrase n=1 Tax=Halosquirtibacter xylanolyticus TaxID=3374599 RepID=UPI0037499D82|nr:tyrosine-type recombinase/integrase [Prolixibacteraceae bacterium]
MSNYISPKEIKQVINRTSDDQTKIIIFFIYNYGMTPEDVVQLTRRNFIIQNQVVRIQFDRIKTQTKHVFRIPDYFTQTLYKVLSRRKEKQPFFVGTNRKAMSAATLENRLFDETLHQNKKLDPRSLWESHLFWIFRKGYNFSEATKEYGIKHEDKEWSIWEEATQEKRVFPRLLDI